MNDCSHSKDLIPQPSDMVKLCNECKNLYVDVQAQRELIETLQNDLKKCYAKR